MLDLIFDTDAGSDCDDMLALGYLIQAQKEGRVRIKAVTYSNVSPHGAAMIRATFRFFGEEAPPVGVMVGGAALQDYYARGVDERFGTAEDRKPADTAVNVLRRALAESDGGIVICAVGPLTNIGALLQSEPDGISPLCGVELVKEKCSRMVLMAGQFTPDKNGDIPPEWNVKCDIPAARAVTELSPVPLAWLPFETGLDMITGRPMLAKYGEASPIALSFNLNPWGRNGRHSWDPATALYTVEGCGDWFVERYGSVFVDENGVTSVSDSSCGENCVVFINVDKNGEAEKKAEIAAYLDDAVMRLHGDCENSL